MSKLEKFMKPWKRHVVDTITYIKPDFIMDVIDILNKYHENIKFTCAVERNGKISFLDVLLMGNNGKLETTVFCKKLVIIYISIGGRLLLLHGRKVHYRH